MWCFPIRAAAVSAAALFASAAAASPEPARVVQTGVFGHWAALEGTTNNGSRMCAVASAGLAPEFRYVAVKFFPDLGRLEIHISKDSWSIPGGTRVPVEIEFNGAEGAWATAGATGNGRMVALTIDPHRAAHFLVEFSRASSGVVRFGGTEAAWAMDLTGSRAAVGAMVDCIRRARAEGGGGRAAQPHADARPPAPAPTQPFAPSGVERQAPPVAPPAFVATGRERRT